MIYMRLMPHVVTRRYFLTFVHHQRIPGEGEWYPDLNAVDWSLLGHRGQVAYDRLDRESWDLWGPATHSMSRCSHEE
jgi:hypothetical protein